MQFVPPEYAPYIQYITPPFTGAFIGYLTNKIAIKMLFRPLKKWRFLGIPVPMTPGVIPSKRHAFAKNIGEMVGDHLLTHEEILKGLQHKKFQTQLFSMIEEKVGMAMLVDLQALPDLIPQRFTTYFDLAVKTIKYQIKESVHTYLQSTNFVASMEKVVDEKLKLLLDVEVFQMSKGNSTGLQSYISDEILNTLSNSPQLEEIIQKEISQRIRTIDSSRTLENLLPEVLVHAFHTEIQKQSPLIIEHLIDIAGQPHNRQKIVKQCVTLIENFIRSLGPLAAMVETLFNREQLVQTIEKHLFDKWSTFDQWLKHERAISFVEKLLVEHFELILHKPVHELLDSFSDTEEICQQLSRTLLRECSVLLRETQFIEILLRDIFPKHGAIRQGVTFGELATLLSGETGISRLEGMIHRECLDAIRAKSTIQALDTAIDRLLDSILHKKIGKLSHLLPSGVRDSISQFIQKMSVSLLEREMSGLVESMQISKIVAAKVNSLDLLQLERLLLSIMEEQFAYINFFGALLGFLIGLGNLLFI